MPSFGYTAIDKSGKEVKGSIEADTEEKVAAEIKRQGLIPMEITKQSALTKDINIEFGGKPTARDMSVFCRQFVSMMRAGVTIIDTMRMLSEQTDNKQLQKAIDESRVSIEKGEPLAVALQEHPKVFPSLLISMVAAGEASGSLDIAMERMAIQFEKSSKTTALVKKAMIYPIVVAIVAVAVVIVMLVVVIPSYTEMFDDLGTELPAITQFVVAASNFIIHRWYILIAIIVALVLAIRAWAITDSGKHILGTLQLKIPGVGNLTTKSAASMMARTLSTLMAAGVPLVEAVDIVSKVMNNIWFKEALEEAKEQIMIGVPLSRPIEESGLFPPMVYHMIHIGEEAGTTEDMLTKLADYYDEEVEMAVQSLMAMMEPVIIIVLAGVVGFLIASVMAPMLAMYQAMDSL